MLSLRFFIALVLCLFTAVVFSQMPHQPPATAEKREPRPRQDAPASAAQPKSREAIAAALNQRVTLEFNQVKLPKALATFSRQIGVEVVLRYDEDLSTPTDPLREPGCEREAEATLTFRATEWRAESVLNVMLDLAEFTWIIRDGMIVVMPLGIAEEMFQARSFAIDKCLEYERAHRPYQDQEVHHPYNGLVPPTLPHEFYGGDIEEAIMAVSPGPWIDLDGIGGKVLLDTAGKVVVVRAAQPYMNDVERMLAAMTAFTRGEFRGSSRIVSSRWAPSIGSDEWQRILRQRVRFDFGELPLNKFAAMLSKYFDRPVWLDTAALAEEGIRSKESIRLNVKSISLSHGLELALSPLGLTCMLAGDLVYITPVVHAEERQYVVAYDTRDFLRARVDSDTLIEFSLEMTSGPWINIDGTGGQIEEPLPGLLLVRQTHANHDEIARLLANLGQTSTPVKTHRNTADRTPDPNEVVTHICTPNVKDLPAAVKAVKQFVEPSAWQGQGGTGQILIVDNKMIVRNRSHVIATVRRFLSDLTSDGADRRFGGFGGTADPRQIRER